MRDGFLDWRAAVAEVDVPDSPHRIQNAAAVNVGEVYALGSDEYPRRALPHGARMSHGMPHRLGYTSLEVCSIDHVVLQWFSCRNGGIPEHALSKCIYPKKSRSYP
jgi:hypothetical protein